MDVRVFLGTGGVGKTSLAAATALQAAIRGEKCLILAIDPALRLRTALGMSAAVGQQKVALDEYAAAGELWAAMLDVRATLDRAVHLYAKPTQAETVLNHPIYQSLIASLSGMQELMAIERLDQAITDGFTTVVIDTAPSRHALEFLDKPEYFAQAASSPVVQLVGRAYTLWNHSPFAALSRKSLDLYSRIEALLGVTLVRQVLDFYSVFFTIAEGYADRARRTTLLLRDRNTTGFSVVTTPFKAVRDAAFFARELQMRRFPIFNLTVNRVWPEVHVTLAPDAPAVTREALRWYEDVSQAHQRAWDHVRTVYTGRVPSVTQVPELPRDVDGLPALYQIAQWLDGSAPSRAHRGFGE